jgi:hypothetical protein
VSLSNRASTPRRAPAEVGESWELDMAFQGKTKRAMQQFPSPEEL